VNPQTTSYQTPAVTPSSPDAGQVNHTESPLRANFARKYSGLEMLPPFSDGALLLTQSSLSFLDNSQKILFSYHPSDLKSIVVSTSEIIIKPKSGIRFTVSLNVDATNSEMIGVALGGIFGIVKMEKAEKTSARQTWLVDLKAQGYPTINVGQKQVLLMGFGAAALFLVGVLIYVALT
jgi:hypothetical protein